MLPAKTLGKWQFWIDRGGTFTDIVALRPDGRIVTHKLLSEAPEAYADAALAGIRDLLGIDRSAPIPPGQIAVVKMGTTLATNALLERKGARTLLLTTKGFGDALRIGYQNRPRLFDLHIVLPEPLYEEVLEADERITSQGEVLQPFNSKSVRPALESAITPGNSLNRRRVLAPGCKSSSRPMKPKPSNSPAKWDSPRCRFRIKSAR